MFTDTASKLTSTNAEQASYGYEKQIKLIRLTESDVLPLLTLVDLLWPEDALDHFVPLALLVPHLHRLLRPSARLLVLAIRPKLFGHPRLMFGVVFQLEGELVLTRFIYSSFP